MTKSQNWKKETALNHWKTLDENVDPYRNMNSIPYKAKGSKYGACGIRIDGTPDFIDDILARLKGIIKGENGNTRLEVARRAVESVTINGETKYFENSEAQSEVCYIRLHERGREAQMCNALFGH